MAGQRCGKALRHKALVTQSIKRWFVTSWFPSKGDKWTRLQRCTTSRAPLLAEERLEGLEDFQLLRLGTKHKTGNKGLSQMCDKQPLLPCPRLCKRGSYVTWITSFSVLVHLQFSRSSSNTAHGYLLFTLAFKFKSPVRDRTHTKRPGKQLGQTKTDFLHSYNYLQLLGKLGNTWTSLMTAFWLSKRKRGEKVWG